jgi:probable rRNA maturation factor
VTTISVRSLQRGTAVDVRPLEKFAERALRLSLAAWPKRKSNLAGLTNVEVLLVSDRRIAALHREFMNIPGPTDVITFQHGEIFISVDTAEENARRFRSTIVDELRLYIVHALLHLHGFDDKSPARAHVMEAAQKRIVAEANERD